ncbi:histidine-containing phosphotransfer protein 1 [Prunus yedoensis var. nudiflora]|uniref:Histidine-containing phosphotransfer protein n=1 Tax=Prunus yedoensis var. nudiflora TaxID=2094558 RepID=A0A314UCD5_PRUYE|nr:histidine-containing phosphotransfer protein 1 [Prunus yedoensis var. nudiflora]
MDAVTQWQKQWFDYTQSLRREGFLDDQFAQLKKLQDESSPDFVVERTNVVNFKQVDAYVHQFKGSSAWIGALRLKNVCINFRNSCEAQNLEGCLRCLQQVKQESSALKSKLEYLFRLEQQIVAAGGSIPIME